MMTDPYIETAFDSFLQNTQKILTKHCLRHGYNLHKLSVSSGRKYWKIILVDGWNIDQRVTFGFVRKSDGAISKTRSGSKGKIRAYVTDDDNGQTAITRHATIRGEHCG